MEPGLKQKRPASVGPQLKLGGRKTAQRSGRKITPHQRPKAATPPGVAQNHSWISVYRTRNSGSLCSEVQAISHFRHSASAAGLELSGHPGAQALPLGSVMLQSYESGLKVRAVILPPPNLRHPATAEYVWGSLAKE